MKKKKMRGLLNGVFSFGHHSKIYPRPTELIVTRAGACGMAVVIV